MIKNYLLTAWRNLLRRRIYSVINVSGLAVGLACCALIMLYVQDELKYDQFHTNKDQIFRLITEWGEPGNRMGTPIASYRIGPELMEAFPQMEAMVRFSPAAAMVQFDDKSFQEERMALADEKVFEVFSFPLLKGDPATALVEPFTMVISESTAKKWFGEEEAMGRTVNVRGMYDVKITGVMADMPQHSHMHFDVLGSMSTGRQVFPSIVLENYGEGSQYTFFQIPDEQEVAKIEAQFPDLLKQKMGEQRAQGIRLSLQPITDIHLHSHLAGEAEANGDIRYVYLFSLIAVFILLIACINYMNLATARASTRMKEVGMRKVVGARRFQLIAQFMGESILMAFLALGLAILISESALPFFNNISGKELIISYLPGQGFILEALALALIVGLLAGSYPAFMLSAFKPVSVLKGRVQSGSRSSSLLRQGLVVLQFSISIALIVGTLTIRDQLIFLRSTDLGIHTEQVVIMPMPADSVPRDYPLVKQELLRSPKVVGVTASNKRLTRRLSSTLDHKVEGVDPNTADKGLKTLTVDHDFFTTLDAELVAGRFFDKQYGTDAEEGFMLNETAVRQLGLTPESALGRQISTETLTPQISWREKKGTIVGVVKDFHFESLESEILAMAFHISENWLNWVSVRVSPEDLPATLEHIEGVWEQFNPVAPFIYTFLDDDINALYGEQQRFLEVVTTFSLIAILIACLGIFGLAAYMAERRTKEIGIRKVLGASINDLTGLLTREFAILVLISAIVGCPVAAYFLYDWLQEFPYHVDLRAWMFGLAIFLAMIIALGSAAYHALKAAYSNPIQAIKYE